MKNYLSIIIYVLLISIIVGIMYLFFKQSKSESFDFYYPIQKGFPIIPIFGPKNHLNYSPKYDPKKPINIPRHFGNKFPRPIINEQKCFSIGSKTYCSVEHMPTPKNCTIVLEKIPNVPRIEKIVCETTI